MSRRKRTEAFVVLAACVALLLAAVPALAKKPQRPATYTVEMQFVDVLPGMSTDCMPEGSIVMTGTTRADRLNLSDTGAVAINLRVPGVGWQRNYPDSTAGNEFDGCHGPSVYDGSDHPYADYGGYLSITLNDTAGTVEFLWHFDYYIDGEDRGKKKTRWVGTVREHYTMSATADYDPTTGLVHGWFPVAWYLNEDGTLVHLYDPFPPTEGTEMTFELSVIKN